MVLPGNHEASCQELLSYLQTTKPQNNNSAIPQKTATLQNRKNAKTAKPQQLQKTATTAKPQNTAKPQILLLHTFHF
jgi:hypothetical protein